MPHDVLEREPAALQATESVAKVIVETRGSSLGWKARLARIGIIGGMGASLGVGAMWLTDHVPHIPNPLPAIEDFIHGVGEDLGDIIHHGKDGADRTVADLSHRKAQPLEVKPENVVRKAIFGQTSYGEAQREIEIKKATKKWNSFWPQNDEFVNLYDGLYVEEAKVEGTPSIQTVSKNSMVISLPAAMRNPDITIRRQPHVNDNPQLWPQFGQLPGAITNTDIARDELDHYIARLEDKDIHLLDAATCWGVESAKLIAEPVLRQAGFAVRFIDESNELVADRTESGKVVTIKFRIPAPFASTHVHKVPATDGSGRMVSDGSFDTAACDEILTHTKMPGGEGPVELAKFTDEDVKLSQSKK